MQSIKAILYDLDGTLVDSAPQLWRALLLTWQNNHLPPFTHSSFEFWRKHASRGGQHLIQLANKLSGETLAPLQCTEIQDDFLQTYLTICAQSFLFAGVEETLQTLGYSYQQAIVTNKWRQYTLETLSSHLCLLPFPLICGDDGAKPKPSPETIIKMCQKLSLHPHNVVYVGDTENDFLAAQAAGCPFVFASYGYYPDTTWVTPKERQVTSFTQLPNILQQMQKM